MADGASAPVRLQVLVVDDEVPAREELAFLLGEDPRVETVRTATNAAHALKLLNDQLFDVVFCDIKMPGLDGVELARVVSRFTHRPQVVFVTAYDDHAVDAFDLQATDYLMKPVHADRLAEAVRRVVTAGQPDTSTAEDETIAVELAGVTRFVRRSQVRFVEAQGDYARLHTAEDSHLLRTPLTVLEQRWSAAGFVRIHRSTLVALAHIDEVRVADGRTTVRLGKDELPVSRRHTRSLRDRLTPL
ncbi:LytTR family DNA-binding domain-containing protein [Jatrophihabitans cynanchi]|jgi:DNA-binding LytR/AlgR family response regulator|uniref:LytTR family DNA-binding domain-containing protein n=1 Tax=Jatrophihabitans cynanchi TaxID=2944128 RepID=A0ABY7JZ72_9ACTN|nr:LytTR family DNA-binding domain-containing protein [Jatrophihabitans sp. SB3-54]WAX56953.1 LytTR family DNA-binding domain-containing protein [Jatrophihabitans sp. SB3-54]